jgi:hypothetical protein
LSGALALLRRRPLIGRVYGLTSLGIGVAMAGGGLLVDGTFPPRHLPDRRVRCLLVTLAIAPTTLRAPSSPTEPWPS